MPRYRYLIVGGGMAADAAARGIRERDAQGSIGLVGEEPSPPYARPPLSKGLWFGKSTLDQLPIHPEGFYAEKKVELTVKVPKSLRKDFRAALKADKKDADEVVTALLRAWLDG